MGPSRIGRSSVRPNPLNPSGWIRLSTILPGCGTVGIYDVSGRLCRKLSISPTAGVHEVLFDGRDQQGNLLGSGVYFYRIEDCEEELRGRLVIAR